MTPPSRSMAFRKVLPFIIALGVLVIIAIWVALFGTTVMNRVVTVMFVQLVLVLGLQMFMGNSGILSFAHVGFMAIGAYASALVSIPAENKSQSLPNLYEPLKNIEVGFLPAILIGATLAGIFAAVTGIALMRLSDTAAAISSFALLVIVNVVLSQWNQVTNGPRTLSGILRYTDMWTAFGWAVVILLVAFLFKESSLGMKLRASRDNLHAADAIGINVVKTRWISFVLSAFIAGLAGGLWAHFITSFQPDSLYFEMTFLILMMLVVGGTQTITGATLGVIVITVVYEGLRSIENNLALSGALPFKTVGMTEILLAIALILMLALRPGGIIHTSELGSGVRRRQKHISKPG